MDNKEAEAGRNFFLSDIDEEMTAELAEPIGVDRPISTVETGLDPGGEKSHKWYMDTRFHGALVASGFIFLAFIINWGVNGGGRPPAVVARETQEIADLKRKLHKSELKAQGSQQANTGLTQGAQFDAVPLNTPPGKPGQPKPTSQKPQLATASSRRKPVSPRNTVRVPRRSITSGYPRSPQRVAVAPRKTLARPFKPSGPSLSDCVGYAQTGLVVPACSGHRIKEKTEPKQAPISIGQKPRLPARRPVNLTPYKPPTKTAYAPRPEKVQPSYKVNYLAGEIQTIDQYEQEFYGSGQKDSPVKKVMMTAKVIDLVEWDSAQVAQETVIPLKITSGPYKGQGAEAKITKLNGLQFTAHLITLNNQPVEAGKMELRRKNTRYLRAKIKRHGGSSFKDQIVATGLGIAGEVASNRLANVEGGNRLSGLVPQGNRSRGQVSQTWRFDGDVEIHPM